MENEAAEVVAQVGHGDPASSPDLWRGRCLFMQPDLHRTLHFEYPSEQTMPEKAQIG